MIHDSVILKNRRHNMGRSGLPTIHVPLISRQISLISPYVPFAGTSPTSITSSPPSHLQTRFSSFVYSLFETPACKCSHLPVTFWKPLSNKYYNVEKHCGDREAIWSWFCLNSGWVTGDFGVIFLGRSGAPQSSAHPVTKIATSCCSQLVLLFSLAVSVPFTPFLTFFPLGFPVWGNLFCY